MSEKQMENKPRKKVVPKSAWKPGQSGNPKGRPPLGESLTETMRQFLDEAPEGQELTYKQMFVKKSYQKAYEGDPTFAKLVWNYIDGMPRPQLPVDKEGNEVKQILVQFVGEEDK